MAHAGILNSSNHEVHAEKCLKPTGKPTVLLDVTKHYFEREVQELQYTQNTTRIEPNEDHAVTKIIKKWPSLIGLLDVGRTSQNVRRALTIIGAPTALLEDKVLDVVIEVCTAARDQLIQKAGKYDFTIANVVTSFRTATLALVLEGIQRVPMVAAQSSTDYGNVLSNGIQDISALAGLLGTEGCAGHSLNCLRGGYMYAASQPWSMFGSLGIVKASMYMLIRFEWLEAAGFTQFEKTLGFLRDGEIKYKSLLHWAMATQRALPPQKITEIALTPYNWLKMAALAAALGSIGILPFLWPLIAYWSPVYSVFPILRVLGSCCLSAVVPFRLLLIFTGAYKPVLNYLSAISMTVSAASVVVGYIGSFTYVQQFPDSRMTYLWLGLEVLLSLARLVIWATNTDKDDLKEMKICYTVDRSYAGKFSLPAIKAVGPGVPAILYTIGNYDLQRMLVHAGLEYVKTPVPGTVAFVQGIGGGRLYFLHTERMEVEVEGKLKWRRPVYLVDVGDSPKLTLCGWAISGREATRTQAGMAIVDIQTQIQLPEQYEKLTKTEDNLPSELRRLFLACGTFGSLNYEVGITMEPFKLSVRLLKSEKETVDTGDNYYKSCHCANCNDVEIIPRGINAGYGIEVFATATGLDLATIQCPADAGGPLTGLYALIDLAAKSSTIKMYLVLRASSVPRIWEKDIGLKDSMVGELQIAALFYILFEYRHRFNGKALDKFYKKYYMASWFYHERLELDAAALGVELDVKCRSGSSTRLKDVIDDGLAGDRELTFEDARTIIVQPEASQELLKCISM